MIPSDLFHVFIFAVAIIACHGRCIVFALLISSVESDSHFINRIKSTHKLQIPDCHYYWIQAGTTHEPWVVANIFNIDFADRFADYLFPKLFKMRETFPNVSAGYFDKI
jgi:hypothetical protein